MDDFGKYNKEIVSQIPLLEDFFYDLINNNYSEKTVLNYQRDLLVFASFLFSQKLNFKDIGKLDLIKYKDYLRNGRYLNDMTLLYNQENASLKSVKSHPVTQSEISTSKASRRSSMYQGRLGSRSVNRMLSALRSYFRFLTDADEKVPIPADAIKLIKTEKVVSNVAELDELISLIESPENFETKKNIRFRNRAMLELLFSTGMRISELINLNLEDLKLDESKKVIQDERIFITGKGKKQRFVYLTERAKHYLERYLMTRDDEFKALFIPYRGSRRGAESPYSVRVSVNYLQYKIKLYRNRLGINIPTSAHSLRHGFATYLSENGANPASIQRLLGHESLQTTSRYVHTSDRVAQKSHNEFHPLKE
jgi:site-specific recombinase XerD